ncbi:MULTISPECIES: hypothetical protein [Bacillaceae]|uniref:Uncharacterized protein n=1 Tax=Evansella alkalicola TaxID=745819 RepID=A0ABS6JQV3_9BACI|nr:MULTISPECIES: hypothetical protein [Bacillaceae]MBU9720936.1 hypothetical protein [Bacillus alkalicola]
MNKMIKDIELKKQKLEKLVSKLQKQGVHAELCMRKYPSQKQRRDNI